MRLVTLLGAVAVVGAAAVVGHNMGTTHVTITPGHPTTTTVAPAPPVSVIGQPLEVHRTTTTTVRPAAAAIRRLASPAPAVTVPPAADVAVASVSKADPIPSTTTSTLHAVNGADMPPAYVVQYVISNPDGSISYTTTKPTAPPSTTTTTRPAVGIVGVHAGG